MELCFATNNLHKIQEVQAILAGRHTILGLADIGCTEELLEEQDTIPGNSFQKADYVFRTYNVPCFADDSGLEVEALNGAPGVHSAYFAGPQRSHQDNMNLVLSKLSNTENRRAQFRTVITLVTASMTQQFEGVLRGTILTEKRGYGGFGYDPIFLPDGYSKTLAEMSAEEKNQISHRARAIAQLIEFLKDK
ncbi:MAG: RdgB/HAM1 family non-canonical purine NTP pyrophosphatase [Cytophagales bacterium]|jgi:XTP/dITP diphosphohydrolase|nr:RdgB/HAM1 family non-canonical purine NTP pyrophosphatase [Cytophagales bacterium]MCA6387129.1 RdgB/HAM1 family non-canonical purine NTP pyrophosphatase [Cytophagales bacterium]MCA6390374.1 RdgB/HAM1 family non-canonical purine NTP pyrophosphatase [Cytophagales bacterium]MCA6396121.1 RdgB/HAM1 family non-canonical purine NTP pyrophosphatase [Cytophagales bacterium]MCA6399718.1 RdgB/HAM1 family non-canonical purine NTP pyrophosphatase [Cytophagales bacterium]